MDRLRSPLSELGRLATGGMSVMAFPGEAKITEIWTTRPIFRDPSTIDTELVGVLSSETTADFYARNINTKYRIPIVGGQSRNAKQR